MPDLIDLLESAVREHVLHEMPPPEFGQFDDMELADLLHVYGNWRYRCPAPRPRTNHVSRELAAELAAAAERSIIEEVLSKIEAGENLKPHLSTTG